MTPYYSDDFVTIYHGDCSDVMGSLPDESVNIVVTSPPYNMGLTPGGNGRGMYGHRTQKAARFTVDGYDGEPDAVDLDEYAAFHRRALAEMWRCASSAVFWNHRPRVIHGRLVDPLDGDFGLPLRQRIILDRGTGIDVNLGHFCTRGEYLLLFAKPSFRLASHAASGMGDVWRIPIVTGSEHPAPFSVEVPGKCIDATGAGSVLDPFCGSGTTLRAAKDRGVRAIGIEKSERYCEVAARRMQQEVLDFGGAA